MGSAPFRCSYCIVLLLVGVWSIRTTPSVTVALTCDDLFGPRFYYNAVSGSTQWEKPEAAPVHRVAHAAPLLAITHSTKVYIFSVYIYI